MRIWLCSKNMKNKHEVSLPISGMDIDLARPFVKSYTYSDTGVLAIVKLC